MIHLIIAEKDELITKDLIVGILDSLVTETKGTNGVFVLFHLTQYNKIKDVLVDDDWLNGKLKELFKTNISTHYEKSDKVHVSFTPIFNDETIIHIQPIMFVGIDYGGYQFPSFTRYIQDQFDQTYFEQTYKMPYFKK